MWRHRGFMQGRTGGSATNQVSCEAPYRNRRSTMTEPSLLDMTRDTLRRKHCSLRTEESYLRWIRQYILFNDKRHPKEMGAPELEAVCVRFHPESGVQRDPLPLPACPPQ